MATLIPFFVFCQALGAFIGAFSAIFGELSYARAMRDGQVDAAERAHLDALAKGLRLGMTLLLLSSLALVVAQFSLGGMLQPALTAGYWTSIALALLIIWGSWALSRRRVSFAFGSALLFTAWWYLVYLTIGWLPPLSFGAALALFVIATALFYAFFRYARLFVLHKP